MGQDGQEDGDAAVKHLFDCSELYGRWIACDEKTKMTLTSGWRWMTTDERRGRIQIMSWLGGLTFLDILCPQRDFPIPALRRTQR